MTEQSRLPQRIQRKRIKGWRMPAGAIYVGRGTEFGNPFPVSEAEEFHRLFGPPDNGETTVQTAVRWYREWLNGEPVDREAAPPSRERIGLLRGKDLACWCKLSEPCHADVLLEIANGGSQR